MAALESKPTSQQNEIETLQKKIKQLENSLKKQQTKAQKKIKALRHYYESMLDVMPGHVYWLDRHNRYLGCNHLQAKNAGLISRKAIIGKKNSDLPWKKQAEFVDKINDQVMSTGIPITVEEFANTITGQRTFISHKVPLFNDNNEVIGLIGVSVDMTEQKMAEKRLAEALDLAEAASHAKNAFIANMSHDIRTPLSGIIGMSSLLEKRLKNKENQQYAHWIYESGNQLLYLLNHILELVSSDNLKEHGQQEESFSLQTLINDIVRLEQPTVHLKKIDLRTKIASNLPNYIYADRFKLHRILLNLFGNAVKFTQEGFIELQLLVENETDSDLSLAFHIKDSGIGIPESAQPHVFDRFFRAHPSDKGIYPGSGVGLNIVKTYIDLLGGTINLISEVNKGSTFSFYLKVKKQSPSYIIQPTETITSDLTLADNESSLRHLNFLLIEDNPIALKLLEQLLNKLGHTFQSATTAEEGWNILQEQMFDIIITDIGLPGLSGIELTKLIREQSKFADIKIAGLTAHATKETSRTCLKIGMNAVLIKPINLPQLQQVINQLTYQPLEHTVAEPLGKDLPENEQALFQINNLPLLDIQHAVELLGDKTILKDMLNMMIHEQIPHDLPLLNNAYENKDWKKIEALAHKMKAGALYCGTVRLQIACQYLERYYKAGHVKQLDALYRQLMDTLSDTIEMISDVEL